MRDRTALVTGSTSGIGLGVARALAAEGARIALNGIEAPDDVEPIRAGLESEFGVRCLYQQANLCNHGEIHALIERTAAELGGPDILVNNAGVQHTDTIEDFPPEKWDQVLQLNLSAAFHTMQAVLPGMRERGWGRVINIASAHGLVASPNKAAYVAAKHGLVGLTKVAALEAAGSGITINAICPGWVLTPLVQKQIDAIAEREGISEADARLKLLSEKQPSQQFVKPDQIGGFAVFLCSDAAQQITGAPLSIDGGWTAQ